MGKKLDAFSKVAAQREIEFLLMPFMNSGFIVRNKKILLNIINIVLDANAFYTGNAQQNDGNNAKNDSFKLEISQQAF